MVEKIFKRLKLLTKGMDTAEKMKYLKTLGYNTPDDIKNLSDNEKEDLYNMLLRKEVTEYEVHETPTHIISRPKKPKHVKDISFKIKGFTP